jgi:hypothetical protein
MSNFRTMFCNLAHLEAQTQHIYAYTQNEYVFVKSSESRNNRNVRRKIKTEFPGQEYLIIAGVTSKESLKLLRKELEQTFEVDGNNFIRIRADFNDVRREIMRLYGDASYDLEYKDDPSDYPSDYPSDSDDESYHPSDDEGDEREVKEREVKEREVKEREIKEETSEDVNILKVKTIHGKKRCLVEGISGKYTLDEINGYKRQGFKMFDKQELPNGIYWVGWKTGWVDEECIDFGNNKRRRTEE